MKSKVYFIKVENGEGVASLAQKTGQLFDFAGFKDAISKKDMVAVKTRFGTFEFVILKLFRILDFVLWKSKRYAATRTRVLCVDDEFDITYVISLPSRLLSFLDYPP